MNWISTSSFIFFVFFLLYNLSRGVKAMNKINEKIILTIKENLFDETISTILIYGSQVTGLSNCDSDIDVIVTTYGNKELIGRTIIDDKIIEYHVIPMEMVYSLSADEIVTDW